MRWSYMQIRRAFMVPIASSSKCWATSWSLALFMKRNDFVKGVGIIVNDSDEGQGANIGIYR